jgi:hypothetical protein
MPTALKSTLQLSGLSLWAYNQPHTLHRPFWVVEPHGLNSGEKSVVHVADKSSLWPALDQP